MIELRNLPKNLTIDTGPLLLPLTREPGWKNVKNILATHEEGKITLNLGLFNIGELIYAAYRLGYNMETTLEYARLISDKLNIVKDQKYITWMGRLRIESYKHNYNIPWGNISSTSTAITQKTPLLILSRDKHFKQLTKICNKIKKPIKTIHIEKL
ncbi:MAG: hypothetical protein NDF54_10330 [archaeon GB-1867-035]|nr:hypothetical protein [Candidatus Culexmicrobium profundum]